MKSVWIFYVLQIQRASCYVQLSRTSLEITFQHYFTDLPNLGDAMVWPIAVHSMIFEPQTYTTNNIPKFASDKTYLILTKSHPKRIRIFYWAGSIASLVAKKKAANYAFQVYLIIKQTFGHQATVSINREAEFIESRSFEDTIYFENKIIATPTATFLNDYVDEQLPYKLPNLYIVRGTSSTTRVKAVPMGTQWFMYDACLVLETGFKVEGLKAVTLYCGPNVNGKTYLSAKRVAGIINRIYIINNRRESLTEKAMILKAFVEVLENNENYRSHEVDDSNDQLKDAETFVADRDRCISFNRIFQNSIRRTDPRPYESFSHYYHNIEKFGIPGIYLLDSASVAGLFLHIHNNSSIAEKLKGLEIAEEYLHKKYTSATKPIRMIITEIPEFGTMPVNLSINMSNFPISWEQFEEDVDDE